jgi:hypothetical protein
MKNVAATEYTHAVPMATATKTIMSSVLFFKAETAPVKKLVDA